MQRPILLLFIVIFLCSCGLADRRHAIEFNNTLARINQGLYSRGKAYGQLLGEAYKAKDYTKLKQPRLEYQHFVDSASTAVMMLGNTNGSEQLKRCEMELLRVEKHLIDVDLFAFEQLSADATQGEVQALFSATINDSKKETEVLDRLKRLQTDYSKKNGFTVIAGYHP
jgi:hypothetical protein